MILVRLQGGLGNQMFQYAFARSLAIERNDELLLDLSLLYPTESNSTTVKREFELDLAFGLSLKVASERLVEKFNGKSNPNLFDRLVFWINKKRGKYPLLVQEGHKLVDWNSIPFPDVCLVGRFQSFPPIHSIDQLIRKEFSLKKLPVNDLTRQVINDVTPHVTVSVHVRRGDYIDHPVYSKILGGLNMEYYRQAVSFVQTKLEAGVLKFIVVSDDIDWCKANLSWIDNAYFHDSTKGPLAHFSDLFLLASTDHAIISNSTFGWWGGYLGDRKRVVCAPRTWSRDKAYSPPDLIPEFWNLIDNHFE